MEMKMIQTIAAVIMIALFILSFIIPALKPLSAVMPFLAGIAAAHLWLR